MSKTILVMPGSASIDLKLLRDVASPFEWSVEVVNQLPHRRRPAALLFHRDAFGHCSWRDAIRRIKATLPDVLPVVCHGVADPVDWQELSAAGAFHSIRLPLQENEIRQSLGFIWEAENRRALSAESRVGARPRDIRSRPINGHHRLVQQSKVYR